MASKTYLKISVDQATDHRLDFIFKHYKKVMVAFSGGKDSGVLLNLAYKKAKDLGRLADFGYYFLDYEVQYQLTIDYVKRVFDHMNDVGYRYWICLPNSVPSATSMTTGTWTPWEQSKKDIWVRKMPSQKHVINQDNVPWDYHPGTIDYRMQEDFGRWFSSKHGKSAMLIGIRTQESLDRYRAIKSSKKVNDEFSKNYLVQRDATTTNAYPIYDWEVRDIWIANAKFGFDYNHLYDLYYKADIPIEQMRVASPFLSEGMETLKYYQVIEPDTWAKMLGRVNGVNFSGLYGGTTAMGWKKITLPDGYTWKKYLNFLLDTLPEETKRDYQKIFKTSIEFWDKTGGALSDKTIDELKAAGIPLEIKGRATNRHSKKKAVLFHDYPDDAEVTEFHTVPSYKRMCVTIMKNDHTAKYMGFARTKAQEEKRKKAIEKYQNIL